MPMTSDTIDDKKQEIKKTSGNKHSNGRERVRLNKSGERRDTMADKVTRPKAAKAASKVLRDGRTSPASKTSAGSALAQVPSRQAAAKRGKK